MNGPRVIRLNPAPANFPDESYGAASGNADFNEPPPMLPDPEPFPESNEHAPIQEQANPYDTDAPAVTSIYSDAYKADDAAFGDGPQETPQLPDVDALPTDDLPNDALPQYGLPNEDLPNRDCHATRSANDDLPNDELPHVGATAAPVGVQFGPTDDGSQTTAVYSETVNSSDDGSATNERQESTIANGAVNIDPAAALLTSGRGCRSIHHTACRNQQPLR